MKTELEITISRIHLYSLMATDTKIEYKPYRNVYGRYHNLKYKTINEYLSRWGLENYWNEIYTKLARQDANRELARKFIQQIKTFDIQDCWREDEVSYMKRIKSLVDKWNDEFMML